MGVRDLRFQRACHVVPCHVSEEAKPPQIPFATKTLPTRKIALQIIVRLPLPDMNFFESNFGKLPNTCLIWASCVTLPA